ncbi:MscS Mechanosensitive ion channel [Acidimicrobium ferrooxidans DSM 10331]|uniref:MscS Mechanosensitive ion channel n=1 Tax=Acidimicrobium ferrooxidans (strain DSM 10331 / JCM 15462 / NBRC 103882 / ICP) TaxID=525909 RepID=C7LYH6_ACIFD|nr:mechanosensitive ion channel domain-containing protein [Acidimicrobium ferrooxidans]ACU53784.1 MscS Mechanosensitive ion channel [Acidimicrobium ferrooxidans DSM 10331]
MSIAHQLLVILPSLGAATVVGLVIAAALVRITRVVNRRHPNSVRTAALRRLIGPVRSGIPLLAMAMVVRSLRLPGATIGDLTHGIELALDAVGTWALARLLEAAEDAILYHYHIEGPDNLRARRLQTQLRVFRRILLVVIVIVALALALFSFPSVRIAGAGLLASAGIVSLVAGVASRPIASNVIAGIQIALAQPIRLDDVVVVDGHWGRIEEINLTYVVVRVWDLRRLVLPISYFTSNAFENWTKTTADILGWVHVEVDYTAPVDAIREAFLHIVADSPDWDGKTARLQVTSLGTSTMQLRLLMSARDSTASWNLQCEVRERLIAYLQRTYPWCLPRLRAEIVEGAESADGERTPRGATQAALPPPVDRSAAP